MVKNPPANAGVTRHVGLIPGLGTSPGSRKCQPATVFLPGKFHRGTWWVIVHGVSKSKTQLND